MFEIVYFLSILVVSGFVLMVSARMLGSKGGLVEAAVASLLGSLIFYFFRGYFLFRFAALILWLLVLKFFFDVGWVRAFLISLVAYVLASLVSLILGIPLLP